MKNTFFLLSAGLILSISAQAQKTKKATPAKINVPENVNASFMGSFATVEKNKWDKTYTGNYVAVFTNSENLSQTAEYNEAGVLVKTKTVYSADALPQIVNTAIETKYAGSKVNECIKMEIPGVAPYFKVRIETVNNLKKELFISEEGVVAE
jgi:hypothetical protein